EAPLDPAEEPKRFPTADPFELDQILRGRSSDESESDEVAPDDAALASVYDLTRIDVANAAFLQTRAKTILRVNPKLPRPEALPKQLWDDLLRAQRDPESNLSLAEWRKRVLETI